MTLCNAQYMHVWAAAADQSPSLHVRMRGHLASGHAGALAGNPFGLDRQTLAQDLGFDGVCPNSMDAVSDRDFVLETLFFSALHLTHLSRWAEDLIIYSSGQFKFVQCSDAYATGEQGCPAAMVDHRRLILQPSLSSTIRRHVLSQHPMQICSNAEIARYTMSGEINCLNQSR